MRDVERTTALAQEERKRELGHESNRSLDDELQLRTVKGKRNGTLAGSVTQAMERMTRLTLSTPRYAYSGRNLPVISQLSAHEVSGDSIGKLKLEL